MEAGSVEKDTEESLDVLTFDGSVLKHVQFVSDASENVFKDFCRLTLDFLHKGHNEKRYNIAAEKLETTPIKIQNVVQGMAYLIINGCKHNLNEKEFVASLSETGFSDANKVIFAKFLNAKKEIINRALSKFDIEMPTFHDLNWRLEAQVATRSHPDHVIPSVLLDFSVVNYNFPIDAEDNPDGKDDESYKVVTHRLVHCDIPNLDNMISNLETALRETKFYKVKNIKTALMKEE